MRGQQANRFVQWWYVNTEHSHRHQRAALCFYPCTSMCTMALPHTHCHRARCPNKLVLPRFVWAKHPFLCGARHLNEKIRVWSVKILSGSNQILIFGLYYDSMLGATAAGVIIFPSCLFHSHEPFTQLNASIWMIGIEFSIVMLSASIQGYGHWSGQRSSSLSVTIHIFIHNLLREPHPPPPHLEMFLMRSWTMTDLDYTNLTHT